MRLIKQRDPIEVIAVFGTDSLKPHSFKWSGKRFVVEKINLTFSRRTGDGREVYYAVSAEGNYFKLVLETTALRWFLEEAEIE